MRGGYLHCHIMAAELARALRSLGAVVHVEHWIAHGEVRGAIDVWAVWRTLRLAFEIELRPDRISKDVAKARAASAHALVIVAPEPSAAAAMARAIRRLDEPPTGIRIRVTTFGQALQRLSQPKLFWDFLQ